MSKVFTYAEVSEHSEKEDLYMVIEEKVYDVSKFVDEHPGGEEVMLDVAGQDATEAFNDVGHSDEAREILSRMHIGDLDAAEVDSKPTSDKRMSKSISSVSTTSGLGFGLYALILMGGFAAFIAYKYINSPDINS
ncbi:putative cytochrome b5 [Golovinomyces cichoracearum]|uniref:Putative cytochrome b5 n=1 Tax=Golovinomyces cichoracearum TaxID=62708 RepID=A0A420J568_9PEZI|nr:putative cytochrome b5 [Golovinomyces cichoracearum]